MKASFFLHSRGINCLRSFSIVVLLALGWTSSSERVNAQLSPSDYSYTEIRYPGDHDYTTAVAVDGNRVVGTYMDGMDLGGAFIYEGGIYTPLPSMAPGISGPHVTGISGNNIVGFYGDNAGWYGFVFNGSSYSQLQPPSGANSLLISGISGSQIVGRYHVENAGWSGFLYNRGNFTTIDVPFSAVSPGTETVPTGVNGNNVVGYYFNEAGSARSFLYDGTSYRAILSDYSAVANGIYGDLIVGTYYDANNVAHGFIYSIHNDIFSIFDHPSALYETQLLGISNGSLVGTYSNDEGLFTFLAMSLIPPDSHTINNSAYPFTSTMAQFVVNGNATAAAAAQQVGSLTFLDQGSLFITDSLALNEGLVDVPNGTGTITGGVLVTPGDLTKMGDGLLDLQSDAVTGGDTIVSEGALAVNGTLVTDNVLVQQESMLKGNGTISGNVANSGTVAPGNSPGTLTVIGNFTQSSSGTLEIEVGDGASDLLLVSGTATLGGTLEAVEFGGHEFAFGDQVVFLQAGSIEGGFDQIVVPASFRGRFLANGGTGTLLLAPESYTQVAVGQNQVNVARALDGFIGASGDRDAVSLALDLQTEDEYGNAFDQISPAFFQTLTDTVIEQTNAQNQMLAQRLSAVRLGAKGFAVIGLEQAALKVDRDGKNVMDAKSEKDVINPGTDTDWSVFVQGNGIFSRVTNVSQVPNYKYNSGGFIVGVDYTFGEKATTSTVRDGKTVATSSTTQGSTLTVGAYTGYQGTYAEYANGGDMTINSALFGGYASYTNGGFYSDVIVGGAYNGYRVNRAINFSTVDRTARSTPNGGSFTTYLDAGYDWKVGGFTFGPVLSGQYTYAGTAGFTESGAESLDLAVGQQNANSIRTNVGGRVAFTWNVTDSISIIPEGRMFWQHEYLNGPRGIGATLDGGNGAGFNYETSAPGRDSVFAGAGVSANFGDRWNTGFYYNADFGRQDYVSHMISANLGWKF